MKILYLSIILNIIYLCNASSQLNCITCQSLVWDLNEQLAMKPKSDYVGALSVTILELLEDPCDYSRFMALADKYDAKFEGMIDKCNELLENDELQEILENKLGRLDEATLRKQVCNEYCSDDSLWKDNETPDKLMSKDQRNLIEGQEFLKSNKDKPDIITTESGLQYKVIEESNSEKKPSIDDQVEVHYTGKLLNGDVFDSSEERGTPAKFPVSGVIQGWQEGLQLMSEGSTFEFWIPSDLAYGRQGSGANIKGNSVLHFKVKLLQIIPKEATKNEL